MCQVSVVIYFFFLFQCKSNNFEILAKVDMVNLGIMKFISKFTSEMINTLATIINISVYIVIFHVNY